MSMTRAQVERALRAKVHGVALGLSQEARERLVQRMLDGTAPVRACAPTVTDLAGMSDRLKERLRNAGRDPHPGAEITAAQDSAARKQKYERRLLRRAVDIGFRAAREIEPAAVPGIGSLAIDRWARWLASHFGEQAAETIVRQKIRESKKRGRVVLPDLPDDD
jgi:hypothetical protein